MHEFMAEYIRDNEDKYRKWPASAAVFLPKGRAPRAGEIFVQKELSATIQYMADEESAQRGKSRAAGLKAARDAFYRGDIAQKIARYHQDNGGWVTREDLASFDVRIEPTVKTQYHGVELHACGPWSQGPMLPQVLNLLSGYDLKAMGHNSVAYIHTLTEALKLAFADRHRYYGDPRFVDVPLDRLLSKDYAASLCDRIDLTRAADPASDAGPSLTVQEKGDTVYLVAADRWGNMASFIYSIYDYFGASVSVPGYGFPLNDRGSFFSLDPSSPGVVAPGKRPFLTIIPAFVMKDGEPLLAFGNMGGDTQAQAQATELVNMIDLGMNVQAAGDAARFHHGQSSGDVHLESRLYDLVGAQLGALGHTVVRVEGDDDQFGGYQAVLFERDPQLESPKSRTHAGDPPVNGVYRAASDFRKDGQAVGW